MPLLTKGFVGLTVLANAGGISRVSWAACFLPVVFPLPGINNAFYQGALSCRLKSIDFLKIFFVSLLSLLW
jgi:hypothetical protein